MQVRVYRHEALIGTANLEHLDPPMGVAFGPFVPSAQYNRDQHANLVEGKYFGDRGQSLSVHSDQHGPLKIASIGIEDSSDSENEKQLTVWFQNDDDFAAIFSTHDDYKAYYGR